tara:strand:+ start:185 stop:754 length:570 start_codon:yes stop_codon:yes gene_type:complete
MAQTSNPFDKQIQNRNYLSPIGFKFTLVKAPKVSFFSNTAQIPGLSINAAEQPSYLRNVPQVGDKMDFQDFTLRFLVDEDLENYMQIQNWMRGIAFPESLNEIYTLKAGKTENLMLDPKDPDNLVSDGTLVVLDSSNNAQFMVKFNDLWPTELTTLQFDATPGDLDYFSAEVTFKYTIYEITDNQGTRL